MKCNICGSDKAKIRPMELSVARHSLKVHVDCAGHSEYRTVSRDDVQEAQRLMEAAPEMLELLQRAANIMTSLECLLDTALMGQASVDKAAWDSDVAALLSKIEVGGND